MGIKVIGADSSSAGSETKLLFQETNKKMEKLGRFDDQVERLGRFAEGDPSQINRLRWCSLAAMTLAVAGGTLLTYSLGQGGNWMRTSAVVSVSGILVMAWAANQDRRAFAELANSDKSLKGKVDYLGLDEMAPSMREWYERSGKFLSRALRFLPPEQIEDVEQLLAAVGRKEIETLIEESDVRDQLLNLLDLERCQITDHFFDDEGKPNFSETEEILGMGMGPRIDELIGTGNEELQRFIDQFRINQIGYAMLFRGEEKLDLEALFAKTSLEETEELIAALPHFEIENVQEIQDRIEQEKLETKQIWVRSLPAFGVAVVALALSFAAYRSGNAFGAAVGVGGFSTSLMGVAVTWMYFGGQSVRKRFLIETLERRRNHVIAHSWNLGRLRLPEQKMQIHCLHVEHEVMGRKLRRPVTSDELAQLRDHEIERLEIDGSKLGDGDLASLADQRLKRLYLYGETGPTAAGLGHLTRLHHLERLRLADSAGLTKELVKKMTSLDRLVLGVAHKGDFKAMQSFDSLEEMEIDRADDGLQITDLPDTLSFLRVPRLQPADNPDEANRYRELREVKVTRTDAGSIEALSQLRRLRKIELTGIDDAATDLPLKWVTSSRRTRVERLKIGRIRAFSWEDIEEVAKGRRITDRRGKSIELERLKEIYDNPAIPDRPVIFKEHSNPMAGLT